MLITIEVPENIKKMPAEQIKKIVLTAVDSSSSISTKTASQDESRRKRRAQKRQQMAKGADVMLQDYETDVELTAFTALDGEELITD